MNKGVKKVANVSRVLEKPAEMEISYCRGMHCSDTRLLCQESKETTAEGMVQERKGLSKERGCEDNQANYMVVKCRTLHLPTLPVL